VAVREDREPVELNISTESVAYIITMARRFDAEMEAIEDEEEAEPDFDDPEAQGHARGSAEDTETEELREAIDDLNDDEVVDLIALAWVGRGDFGRDEWEEARALAQERHRRHSADYLMGMPALGDYLEEGLATLGHTYEPP